MESKEDLSIAIDLGGTNMRVAVIDRTGSFLQREEGPTVADRGRVQAVERLTQMITRVSLSLREGRWWE